MTTEPTPTMTEVCDALRAAVPGADPGLLAPDDVIRDVLEVDSLDFLNFVEILSERTGVAIDEDDYASLTTLADCTAFVLARQDVLSAGRTP